MAIELPYGVVDVQEPQVVVHSFGTRDCKTEQRYYIGPGVRRLRVNLSSLNGIRRQNLIDEFQAARGSYAPFDVTYRGTTLSCYFAQPRLEIQSVIDGGQFSSSFDLLVAPASPAGPYTSASTETRFPGSSLKTALLDPVQAVIPMLVVTPRGGTAHYFSDRSVTIDSHAYLPRLTSWAGIQQGLNSADQANFTLGNADRAIRDMVNAEDWYAADVQFSLFHVGTLIKLDLWRGHIIPGGWSFDCGTDFKMTAADGAYELRLAYPPMKITRQTFVFPTDNQPVNVGKGGSITATSVISDSGFGEVVQDIWVDDSDQPLHVKCVALAGRDESEFFAAMGVVGRGPIGEFGQIPLVAGGTVYHWGTLDGQPNHGPGLYGVRRNLGGDPTTGSETQLDNNPDQYSNRIGLDSTGAPPPSGYLVPDGVATLEIRRTDTKGIQPENASKPHEMIAYVSKGNGGYVWSGIGPSWTRTWTPALTNPVWIAINVWLRGNRVGTASQATQEDYFLIPDAIAAAAVCDTMVDKLVGTATPQEKQFTWTGVISPQKPLRDWLKEILASCLGYYTFAFGKLKIGLRWNSSATSSFVLGNMIFNSLDQTESTSEYNHLIATFADREYGYVGNQMEFKQEDHVTAVGMDLTSNINFSGVSTKSQAARVVTTLVREQIGGITADEWAKARRLTFKTTILALEIDCGSIISLVHDDLPTYTGGTANYHEMITEGWTLNPDYSITVEGRTTTDAMYDMTVGDKPVDVPITISPGGIDKIPGVFSFTPAIVQLGFVSLTNCTLGAGSNRGLESIMAFAIYVDETVGSFVTNDADPGTTDPATFNVTGSTTPFAVDDYVLWNEGGNYEIDRVTAKTSSSLTLQRSWPGDAAPNAIFESTRAAHTIGTQILKLDIRSFVFAATTGTYDDITDTSAIPGRFDMALEDATVCAVVALVRNGYGTSAWTVYNCAVADWPGLRTLHPAGDSPLSYPTSSGKVDY